MPKKKPRTPKIVPEQVNESPEEVALDDIEPAPVPPKVGRPTKYRPEYCEELVRHMRTGLSFESFAGAVGVNQDTVHEWAKVHKEFSEAKKIAFAANLLTWEKIGIQGTVGRIDGFNCGSWIFNMKNRHRWNDGHQEAAENPLEAIQAEFKAANEELDRKLRG